MTGLIGLIFVDVILVDVEFLAEDEFEIGR
jgi:hypothetical protein